MKTHDGHTITGQLVHSPTLRNGSVEIARRYEPLGNPIGSAEDFHLVAEVKGTLKVLTTAGDIPLANYQNVRYDHGK